MAEKKLISDVLNASKRATIRKRNDKKINSNGKIVSSLSKVVDVDGEDKKKKTDDDLVIVVDKKYLKVGVSNSSKYVTPNLKKHTLVKRRKKGVTKGPGTKPKPQEFEETVQVVEGPGSSSKRRNVQALFLVSLGKRVT